MEPISLFYPKLALPARVVITAHQKPDGDAMGSSLGLYHFLVQLGHQVTVISPTNWADFLDWMPSVNKVLNFEVTKEKSIALINEADYIFCLDFNVLHRTKHMEKPLADAPGQRILMDHHEQPQVEVFAYGTSDTTKSSTCEMVFDFIIGSGHADKLTLDAAKCLYTGLMTDTGSFRFPAASASVHRMVAHLKDLGLQHTPIHDAIYDSFMENRLRFLGYILLNKMEVFYEYNTVLISVSKQDLLKFNIKTGDTEGLVNYPLGIQGIKMVAMLVDRDEERKWSFRSKGNIDVNTFARTYFEGGGHFNAAGGRSSAPLAENIEQFKQAIKAQKAMLA